MAQAVKTTFRVVTLPILSVLGIVCALYWPQAHGAFCAGLTSTVV